MDLTDAGLWPEIINNDTRMILVQQGSSIVQRLNTMMRNDGTVFKKCKGEVRKLFRDWVFSNFIEWRKNT